MIDKDTKVFFSVASNPGNKGSKFYNSYFKKKIEFTSGEILAKLQAEKQLEIYKKVL